MEKDIQRLSSFQLPNRFVRIGLVITIMAFAALTLIKVLSGPESLVEIAKQLMLAGLLVVSISRDKNEDELIVKLRMQSYSFAFILGILYSLVLPVLDYALDSGLKEAAPEYKGLGNFMILWLLLSVQVFTFYVLKRSYR